MVWLVLVPLLLPLLLWPLARLTAGSARPERAARALALVASITAASGLTGLILVAATLADDIPSVVAYSHRARSLGHVLPEPIPDAVAIAVTVLLALIAGRAVVELRRHRLVARDLHAIGPAPHWLLVVDWDSPRAVAVPPHRGRRGHVLVTSGLLRLLSPREQAAVLAHERAHLRRRHYRTTALAAAAAAVNPLLRPVESVVRLLAERSADEDAAREVADRRLVAQTVAKVAIAAHGSADALGFGGSNTRRRVEALVLPQVGRLRSVAAPDAGAALLGAAALLATAAACIGFVELLLAWLPGR
ncbi:M56 family metallopeptidase [Dactylosporangium sp. NPDC051541]|uniref:M56 family metallopeptidase n=1 Tax=Dactylosporangium sp. NPDC051541 TaxID=3363977 RepID=UPI003788398E